MQLRGNASDTAWKNFPRLRSEFTENFSIEWRNLLHGDVLLAAGHLAVRLTEVDTALDSLWLGHNISGVRGEGFCA